MRLNERGRVLPAIASDDLCNFPCFKGDLVARLRARLPREDRLETAGRLFAALADRTRLKILHTLRSGEELCVCDVAHVLGMSVAAASHHLRKLRDTGILRHRNDGKMVYYALHDRGTAEIVADVLERVKA